MNNAPNHETHQPIKVEIPADDDVMVERGAMPTPSLWQEGVQVTHKATRRVGVVRIVDWKTNQFRLVGEPRTLWQACSDWDVLVEPTPQERAKDAARETLLAEIAGLDKDVLPLVEVLCDHDDPEKALAKLRAMQKLGMLRSPDVVTPEAQVEVKRQRKPKEQP